MLQAQSLDPATLSEFRRVLERNRSELIYNWLHPDGIAAKRFAGAIDGWVSEAARELVVEQVNRNGIMLSNIDEALLRVAVGTFGLCQECGDPIPLKRMAALPWVIHCLYCQKHHERNQPSCRSDLSQRGLSNAA